MNLLSWITFEDIYYISAGPGLLITAGISAWWIYKQIGLTKDQVLGAKEVFTLNSKRESIKLAAEKCNDFNNEIIKKYNSNIYKKSEPHWEIQYNEESFQVILKGKEPTKKEFTEIISTCKDAPRFINDLEGYAIYFIGGIADEEMGFTYTGKVFCDIFKQIVERVGPILLGKPEDNLFPHSRALYQIWNDKLEKRKLELEKIAIDEKIRTTKSISIPSIGTK